MSISKNGEFATTLTAQGHFSQKTKTLGTFLAKIAKFRDIFCSLLLKIQYIYKKI